MLYKIHNLVSHFATKNRFLSRFCAESEHGATKHAASDIDKIECNGDFGVPDHFEMIIVPLAVVVSIAWTALLLALLIV